ncbi:MAG: TIGR00304 family membrane protein [Candidatus Nitrosocaldus sp.]
MDARLLMMIGFALVLVGMLIITFSLATRAAGSSRGRSIGFILLGPIPIVWQGSRSLLVILPISILIMLILFMMVNMR